LLARDQDEAADIVQECLREEPPGKVLDDLVISALVYAKRDRERDDLPEGEEFIVQAADEIGEELIDRMEIPALKSDESGPESSAARPSGCPASSGTRREHSTARLGPDRALVLCCPAEDKEDEAALRLLARTLDPNRWEVDVLSTDTLSSELLSRTGEKKPDLICIAALPPGGQAHTRYLCKRLRLRFPDVKIIVARCGLESSSEENVGMLHLAGADFVTTSLEETRAQLKTWHRILTPPEPAAVERV
jgi:hypothetical protein